MLTLGTDSDKHVCESLTPMYNPGVARNGKVETGGFPELTAQPIQPTGELQVYRRLRLKKRKRKRTSGEVAVDELSFNLWFPHGCAHEHIKSRIKTKAPHPSSFSPVTISLRLSSYPTQVGRVPQNSPFIWLFFT